MSPDTPSPDRIERPPAEQLLSALVAGRKLRRGPNGWFRTTGDGKLYEPVLVKTLIRRGHLNENLTITKNGRRYVGRPHGDVLTPRQLDAALTYYVENQGHLRIVMAAPLPAQQPISIDCGTPKTWTSKEWAWFKKKHRVDIEKAAQAQGVLV